MALLQIVANFCKRTGLPVPVSAEATSDKQTVQLAALLNEVVEELCDRWTWQSLTSEALFMTIAGEDQGSMKILAPEGFARVKSDTLYNRTLRLPLFGPTIASAWQAMKAFPNTGPYYKYRIRGDRLLLNPPGIAGQQIAFEYASYWAVIDGDTGKSKAEFSKDEDSCVFPDRLLIAGLRYKWKAEKGVDYSEELRTFETMATNAAGRDGSKATINLGQEMSDYKPMVFVSSLGVAGGSGSPVPTPAPPAPTPSPGPSPGPGPSPSPPPGPVPSPPPALTGYRLSDAIPRLPIGAGFYSSSIFPPGYYDFTVLFSAGTPIGQILDQNDNIIWDFTDTSDIIYIPAGTSGVYFTYNSSLAGEINFTMTPQGSGTPSPSPSPVPSAFVLYLDGEPLTLDGELLTLPD